MLRGTRPTSSTSSKHRKDAVPKQTSNGVPYAPPLKIDHAHLSTGETREYVVLDDSPTPPPKKRTRAVAAAATMSGASQVASGSGSSSAAAAAKKRKVEKQTLGGSGKRPAGYAYDQTQPVASGSGTHTSSRTYAAPPTAPVAPSAQLACDDAEGHYIINKDDIIHSRYRLVRQLGEGTFGKVVQVVDRTDDKSYAVKIIRSARQYRAASEVEIKVLNELKAGDPDNKSYCVRLLRSFEHRNHTCLLFEMLGPSLFEFMKENSFAPYPMAHVQDFARQLLSAVAYLHGLGMIHTDIKPENILLTDSEFRTSPTKLGEPLRKIPTSTTIRLIDFGSTTRRYDRHQTVISTRHYRAPEVILDLGWSFPCDLFSVGCVLSECFTGEALFQTHDNLEHLAMMEIVIGKMPTDFRRRAARRKPDMFDGRKLDFPNSKTDKGTKQFLKELKNLAVVIPSRDAEHICLCSFITELLQWDPAQRLGARAALQHSFLSLRTSSD